MKLTRKVSADIILTLDGVEHPGIVLENTRIIAKFIERDIMFEFAFYHTTLSMDSGYKRLFQPGDRFDIIRYNFSDDTTPTFGTVLEMFDFSTGVELVNETAIANWVLAQLDPLRDMSAPDPPEVFFSANWEFIP